MKIRIKVSKKDLKHLLPHHTFYDSCGAVERIMVKVQKEAKRLLKSKKSKGSK